MPRRNQTGRNGRGGDRDRYEHFLQEDRESIREIAGMDVLCSDKTGRLTENRLTLGDPILFGGRTPRPQLRKPSLTEFQVKMVTGDNIALTRIFATPRSPALTGPGPGHQQRGAHAHGRRPSPVAFHAFEGGTTTTGQVALRTTRSVTLPIRRSRRALRPCLLITIMSALIFRASPTMT